MESTITTITARCGKAARVTKGQKIKVINTHGEQVVDTWAFRADDITEFMSMEHSRAYFMRLIPIVGDTFVTNQRRPILTIIEDATPGVHDMLIAACDAPRYGLLGFEGYHDNCTDNLTAGLADLGIIKPETPSPLNLFMNIPWEVDGGLSWGEPVSKAGDYVVFEAETDLVVAFSACPQDILPINGINRSPTEAHFQLI